MTTAALAPGRPAFLVLATAIALLYFPCRWFADLKARRSDNWLSYL